MVEPETDSQTVSYKGCPLTGLGPLTVRYNWHQKKKTRKVTHGAANNQMEDYTNKTIFRGVSAVATLLCLLMEVYLQSKPGLKGKNQKATGNRGHWFVCFFV